MRPARPSPCAHRRPLGFSLIELLVVISVVGLLIGLMLPSLSRTRLLAQRTQCSINLRTLATATTMYQNIANRGMFPAVVYTSVYYRALVPFEPEFCRQPFDAMKDYFDVPVPEPVGKGEVFTRRDPFACPGDRVWAPRVGFTYCFEPASNWTEWNAVIDHTKVRPTTLKYERGLPGYHWFWSDLAEDFHKGISPRSRPAFGNRNTITYSGQIDWAGLLPP